MPFCEVCGIHRSDEVMRERVCFECIGDLVRPLLLFGAACLVLGSIVLVGSHFLRGAATVAFFYVPFVLGVLLVSLGGFFVAMGTVIHGVVARARDPIGQRRERPEADDPDAGSWKDH